MKRKCLNLEDVSVLCFDMHNQGYVIYLILEILFVSPAQCSYGVTPDVRPVGSLFTLSYLHLALDMEKSRNLVLIK